MTAPPYNSLNSPPIPGDQPPGTALGTHVTLARHLVALHVLIQRQPTDLDERFVDIRRWLTAEGEYSDLIVEQGLLQDDLQTETEAVPFQHSEESGN